MESKGNGAHTVARILVAVVLASTASVAGQVYSAMAVSSASGSNSLGFGQPTKILHATPLSSVPRNSKPQAPLITSVGGVGLGILVNWAPGSAADGVTNYRLQAIPDDPPAATSASCRKTVSSTAPGSDTMEILSGVCAHVAYRVTATATNLSGTGPTSRQSNPVVPLAATPPGVPLIASMMGRNHSLVVAISPPSYNGGKPLTGYMLTAKTGKTAKSAHLGLGASTVTVSGLANGKSYTLSLVALNSVGRSPAATGTGTPTSPHAPATPQDMTVVPGSSSGSLNVSWLAPADNGGSPITGYVLTSLQLMAKTSKGKLVYAPAPGAKPVTRTVKAASFTMHGLKKANVFYEFKVATKNPKGLSPFTSWSQPATASTILTPATRVLSKSILASLVSDVNGTLTWQYSSDAAVPKLVSSLKTGDVVVGGIAKATPNGILGTVTSVIHPRAGEYIVATNPAPLSAAFSTLTVQGGYGIVPASGGTAGFIPSVPGISVRRAAGFSGLDHTARWTQPSRRAATVDTVSVQIQGQLQLTASGDLEINIHHDWADIPNGADLSFTSGLDTTLSVSTAITGQIQFRKQIGTIPLGAFPVGPIIVEPSIPVFLVVGASGQASVTASATFHFGQKLAWTSDDPGKLSLTNLSQKPTFGAPKVSVLNQFTVTPGIEADPQIELYGVTGPEIDVTIGPEITISPRAKAPDPWLDAGLQVQVDAGWNVNLPFIASAKVTAGTSFSWDHLYELIGSPPSSQPLTVQPANATVDPGGTEQFSVTRASGAVRWTLTGAAGDSINSSGLFTASGPAGRVVTVTATDATSASGSATVDDRRRHRSASGRSPLYLTRMERVRP